MPKQARKKSNANLAPKILIFIGKPIYFLLSSFVVGIILVLSSIGHVTQVLTENLIKTIKPKKKKEKKTIKKKIEVKTKTQNFKNFKNFLKLFFLRVSLLRLKILSKIKKPKFNFKIIFSVVVVLLLTFTFYLLILKDLPSPKELTQRDPEVSTKIYDRNGNLLYKIYKNKNRTIIPITQIPLHVKLATLAAEDAEFYDHLGFSVKGIIRAATSNFHNGSLQGGSTITQQLVKNVLLTPERTIIRKIKELILSVAVESSYTKDQILEMYLNEVSYGGTAYGIEEGSETYFDKDVKDLSLAEAAFLAGIPKAPTVFSPFGQDPDLAFERQRDVLHLMVINKYITKEQEEVALNESLTFAPNKTEIKAPHFVMYVRKLLVDKYGEDMVEKGGLEVTTSLDLGVQELSEKIVKDEVEKIKSLHVGNGSSLILNPQTGEILAMVGSKDYFDVKNDGNVNVLTRLRQPGSAVKVVNYAYALSTKYTPSTIIDDSPITYSTPGSPPYSPKNYDGKFLGKVTLRSALAQSRNIPAVKILASYGVSKMVEMGKSMGITTWDDPSQYGLSLTLGGGAVKAIDLAKVFSTIANNGKRPDLISILDVKDYKGHVLEKNKPSNLEILDPRVAYLLIDILKDNTARAPEFGFNSYLAIKDHPEVAVKTGTSNDLRDNWAVGFNQNFLVLTWVGNNDNSEMSRIASGVTGASPVWNKIMTALLADDPSIDWRTPDGLVKINCLGKGEWFLKENIPTNYCKPVPSLTPNETTNGLPGGKILDSGISTVRR
ncbi:MAG TPA: PBP1A family penicillin-binding protein [Patescibacteria group bacterium]|nr:PBP1A family penicillin-binding protein [Patescibacteria group bacterium]